MACRTRASTPHAANLALGLPADAREYYVAAHILKSLGITRLQLLSNNPDKPEALGRCGITVEKRVPLITATKPLQRDISCHQAREIRSYPAAVSSVEPLKGNCVSHRIAIVISRFNEKVTTGLLNGARRPNLPNAALRLPTPTSSMCRVPSKFRLWQRSWRRPASSTASSLSRAVIKGETAHFEYISEAARPRADEGLARDRNSGYLRHSHHLHRRSGLRPLG